ncbi:MAG TPA: hypothetical protein V6D04_11410, partial [Candidatus Obscuribacterales bacterium]
LIVPKLEVLRIGAIEGLKRLTHRSLHRKKTSLTEYASSTKKTGQKIRRKWQQSIKICCNS